MCSNKSYAADRPRLPASVLDALRLFQVGPAVGINGADDLVLSRFLLQRVAEDLQVVVSLDPKVRHCQNKSYMKQRRSPRATGEAGSSRDSICLWLGCHRYNIPTCEKRTFPLLCAESGSDQAEKFPALLETTHCISLSVRRKALVPSLCLGSRKQEMGLQLRFTVLSFISKRAGQGIG